MSNAVSHNPLLLRAERLVVDYLGLSKERDAQVNGFAVKIILDLAWRGDAISSWANYTYQFPSNFHEVRGGELSPLQLNDLWGTCEKILKVYSDTTVADDVGDFALEMMDSVIKRRVGKGSCFGWTLFFVEFFMRICGGNPDMLQKYFVQFCAQRAHAVFLHAESGIYYTGWSKVFSLFPQQFVEGLKRGKWNEQQAAEKCADFIYYDLLNEKFRQRGCRDKIAILDYIPAAGEGLVPLLDRNALSSLLHLTQGLHVILGIFEGKTNRHVVYWHYSPNTSTYVYMDVNTDCINLKDRRAFIDQVVKYLTDPMYKNYAVEDLLCFGGEKLEREKIGEYILKRYEATPTHKTHLEALLTAIRNGNEELFVDLANKLTPSQQNCIALELYLLKYKGQPLGSKEQFSWGREGFLLDKYDTTPADKIKAIEAYMATTFLPTKSTTVEHKRN